MFRVAFKTSDIESESRLYRPSIVVPGIALSIKDEWSRLTLRADMEMLYLGDNVHYRSGYRQFQCSPYSKYDLPPSCAYASGMGQGAEPPSYLPHGFGGYPFQQMTSSCMGFFQRRPGRIKGKWKFISPLIMFTLRSGCVAEFLP